jgi:hypothetical protein
MRHDTILHITSTYQNNARLGLNTLLYGIPYFVTSLCTESEETNSSCYLSGTVGNIQCMYVHRLVLRWPVAPSPAVNDILNSV